MVEYERLVLDQNWKKKSSLPTGPLAVVIIYVSIIYFFALLEWFV